MRPGTRLLLTGAAVTLAVLAVAGAPRAGAQPASVSARAVVSELTGVLGPGSVPADAEAPDEPPTDLTLEVLVENDGAADLSSLRLVVEVFDRTGERSTLRAAVEGGSIETLKTHTEERLVRDGNELAPGEVAGIATTVTGAEAGWLDRGGVYPVKISVVQGTDTLDELTTGVVYLAESPAAPLQTVAVWPLDEAPWRDALGRYPEGVDESIAPGGRLERLLTAGESVPTGGLLLAPAAHLLEDLADRADGFVAVSTDGEERRVAADDPAADRSARFLQRLRTLAGDLAHDPLASPYADADLAAMLADPAALTPMAGSIVAEGRRRVTGLLDRVPDATTALPWTAPSPGALDLLSGDHLLLDYDDVSAVDVEANPTTDLPPLLRTLRSDAGRSVTATIADPFVTETLTTPDLGHGPVVAAQRAAAETAMIFFEFPQQQDRPLLIRPPADWRPDGRVAVLLAQLLDEAPWLELVSPGVQAGAGDTPPPEIQLAGATPTLPGTLGEDLERTRQRLEAVRGAIAEGAPIGGRSHDALADQLLRAPSRWFSRGGTAAAIIAAVDEAITRAIGAVHVPSTGGITLTSETGRIPVTIQRPDEPLLSPLSVEVRVTSGGGLAWPEGQRSEVIELAPGDSETVSFTTRAISRGTFPVTVTVTDPSGELVIQRTQLSVRSTALSGPALMVTGGVVVLLLLAGLVRRRSSKRPQLEVVE